MTDRERLAVRHKPEHVRLALMESGYHFPNEELTELDECIVALGGASENPEGV